MNILEKARQYNEVRKRNRALLRFNGFTYDPLRSKWIKHEEAGAIWFNGTTETWYSSEHYKDLTAALNTEGENHE